MVCAGCVVLLELVTAGWACC